MNTSTRASKILRESRKEYQSILQKNISKQTGKKNVCKAAKEASKQYDKMSWPEALRIAASNGTGTKKVKKTAPKPKPKKSVAVKRDRSQRSLAFKKMVAKKRSKSSCSRSAKTCDNKRNTERTLTNEKITEILLKIASIDPIRPGMCCVYWDAEQQNIVSTDAHILCCVHTHIAAKDHQRLFTTKSRLNKIIKGYDPRVDKFPLENLKKLEEGTATCKNTGLHYPKYMSIIPSDYSTSFTANLSDFYDAAEKSINKPNDHPAFDKNRSRVSLRMTGTVIQLNAELLKKFVKTLMAFGEKATVKIADKDEAPRLAVLFEVGQCTGLIMPTMIKEEDITCQNCQILSLK